MATPTISSSQASSGQITLAQLSVSYTSNTDPLYAIIATTAGVTFGPMTYGGVAMRPRYSAVVGSWTIQIWSMDAPSSGAANIAGLQSGSTFAYGLVLFNVNGASAPSVVPIAVTSATGSSTAPSITYTLGRTGDLIVELVISDINGQTFTDGGGQTRVVTSNAANTQPHTALSTEAGAASVTGSFTLGTTDVWTMLAFALADPGGAVTVDRSSRLGAEVVNDGSNIARSSRIGVEVVNDGTKIIRVSRLGVEVVTVHRFPALTLAR